VRSVGNQLNGGAARDLGFVGSNPDSPLPWNANHLVGAMAAVTVGAVCLLVSWWGASGTWHISLEVAWMNLGLAGAVVIGATMATWVLAGRRALGKRQAIVVGAVEGMLLARGSVTPAGASSTTEWTSRSSPSSTVHADDSMRLVWALGMRHYHREGCQLVRGKQTRAASLRAHEKAGRRPCGMCTGNRHSVS
jgi:hypothetical protein